MALAQKIAYFREKRGLTQQALADRIGVSQVAIHNWESGRNKPRIEAVFRLSAALDVSVSELLSP